MRDRREPRQATGPRTGREDTDVGRRRCAADPCRDPDDRCVLVLGNEGNFASETVPVEVVAAGAGTQADRNVQRR
jgi:hypothetical protein